MAKIVKKKPAAKTPAKSAKKAPVKAASKPAPKKAAPKTVVKKKVEKAPVKAAPKKPEVKKKVEAKVEPKAKVPAKSAKEVKETKAEVAKKEKVEKKAAAAPAPEKTVAPKKDAKAAKKGAKGKGKEKDDSEMDDDFIADDDMMGDEIGEYEEELKAVEESEEEIDVVEEWAPEDKDKSDEEIVLTDAEGRRYCRARDCDQVAVVDVYCRYHYLLFWKKIQVRKKILTDGKLERYVEELTSRYPDKFLEMIRRDLRTEKDFLAAIQELEIDESGAENEFEEDTNAFIEEVRGMGDSGSGASDDDEY
ncbi:hypothetical protein ACLSU7_02755 [Bdellovibrio sp. HCB185ZH]|uniref:hypothetical protein n=1 Tax=Bdellovibrio sp. HCB185ZH TaxID=3394235 RepID=UPI0039A4008E